MLQFSTWSQIGVHLTQLWPTQKENWHLGVKRALMSCRRRLAVLRASCKTFAGPWHSHTPCKQSRYRYIYLYPLKGIAFLGGAVVPNVTHAQRVHLTRPCDITHLVKLLPTGSLPAPMEMEPPVKEETCKEEKRQQDDNEDSWGAWRAKEERQKDSRFRLYVTDCLFYSVHCFIYIVIFELLFFSRLGKLDSRRFSRRCYVESVLRKQRKKNSLKFLRMWKWRSG